MFYLVDGVVATGAGAFNPGQTPPSSPLHDPTVSPPSESNLNLDESSFESQKGNEEHVCHPITSIIPWSLRSNVPCIFTSHQKPLSSL